MHPDGRVPHGNARDVQPYFAAPGSVPTLYPVCKFGAVMVCEPYVVSLLICLGIIEVGGIQEYGNLEILQFVAVVLYFYGLPVSPPIHLRASTSHGYCSFPLNPVRIGKIIGPFPGELRGPPFTIPLRIPSHLPHIVPFEVLPASFDPCPVGSRLRCRIGHGNEIKTYQKKKEHQGVNSSFHNRTSNNSYSIHNFESQIGKRSNLPILNIFFLVFIQSNNPVR